MSTNARDMSTNGDSDSEFRVFEALHAAALNASGIPAGLWRSLHRKITAEIYDAGEVFGIMQYQEEEEQEEEQEQEEVKRSNSEPGISCKVVVTRESGLQASHPDSVFLVDHAWTYRVENARQQLDQVPGLWSRMASLMGLDHHGETPDPHQVQQVLDLMWKFNQTYKVSHGSPEDRVPVWYILDEFGSRIQHSDRPSCCLAPFYYVQGEITYSVLWALEDLQEGDEVTRDFAYGELDPLVRRCRLLPWKPDDLDGVSSVTSEPPDSYYEAIMAENKEQLPVETQTWTVPQDQILKVYSDMTQVKENLTHPRFKLLEEEEEEEGADVIWSYKHIKDFRSLSERHPRVLLNQFPCESVVTVKDVMAAVSRRSAAGDQPDWLPETFNLQTELPQFIKTYRQRQENGEDNHWICKPWNLARGLDTHITNNLDYIIRQRESTPKVVCKYLEDPVLFLRQEVGLVKFDIRYMLLVRSVRPLTLYVYDVFWLRFANRPFSLDHFDDYQKHFTVMNYAEGVQLKQIHYDEFIPMFEQQYPQYPWKEVEAEVFRSFRSFFQAASSRPAPYGVCDYPSSRAIYAVDLMLKWSLDPNGDRVMKPQILELNFSPDCARACKYHPNFYNHVFQTLVLDQPEECPVTRIC